MSHSEFQFKQFLVQQGNVAMRVNTDGVMLGAWTSVGTNKNRALDIGSGTGVIALMIAQRFSDFQIEAIDIEKEAFLTTQLNFSKSVWSTRLKVTHTSLQAFSVSPKFDLIITNPPYFSKSYLSHKREKNVARHNDALPFGELLGFVSRMLNDEGVFSCVLPVSEMDEFVGVAFSKGLFLSRLCEVYPAPTKKANRVLMEFSKKKSTVLESSIIIRNEEREYTEAYRALTKDFYTIF